MQIPDNLTEMVIALKDQYFDLKGLSVYSSLGVSTLRDYIRSGELPCYKIKGKILIKKTEFDTWLEGHRLNKGQDINGMVEEVLASLSV